jgi:hypothetical protein
MPFRKSSNVHSKHIIRNIAILEPTNNVGSRKYPHGIFGCAFCTS